MKKLDKQVLKETVLHGTLKQVKSIFKKHKSATKKSFFYYDLLKVALGRKHLSLVNFLLMQDCAVRNPYEIKIKEETALHLAVHLNNKDIIKKMINKGASIYDINDKGDVPISTAFKKGYYSSVEAILDYCSTLENLNPEDETHIIHFHIACTTDNIDLVELYIKAGFDVNRPLSIDAGIYFSDEKYFCSVSNSYLLEPVIIHPGMTPLSFAAREGFKDLVDLLLENGADCNKTDEEGNTSLHEACKKLGPKRKAILDVLLDYKANIQAVNSRRFTPLHLAFDYANSEEKFAIDFLLSRGFLRSTNFTNDEGLSYFHIACTTNDVDLVKKFLDSGLNIDSTVSSGKYNGYTGLHFAVLHNKKNVVHLLLKRKAQVNVKTRGKELTPLHLACQFNYIKFHELYLKYNEYNKNVRTSMTDNSILADWTLIRLEQEAIIELLIKHGADLEAKDSLGKTPLLHVGIFDIDFCQLNCSYYFRKLLRYVLEDIFEKIFDILLFYEANFNTFTNNQSSLLHIFSENTFIKIPVYIVKLCVHNGLDVNAVNDAGATPLHVAVKFNNKRMVKNLLELNADPNAKCKNTLQNYEIPLDIIMNRFITHSLDVNEDIFCLLLEHGSNINVLYNKTNTVLHDMIKLRKVSLVKNLLHYGADINMQDSEGHCPVYYFFDWGYKFKINWSKSDIKETFEIVFDHVQKLLALDLYVSKQVMRLSNRIYQFYIKYWHDESIDFKPHFNNYLQEKKRMELTMLDDDTLYSILQKSPHQLQIYARNDDFINIINEVVNNDFPLCGHLIKIKLTRSALRRKILQPAKECFNYLIGFHLPDLCAEELFEYLSNEDLDCIITAAIMEE